MKSKDELIEYLENEYRLLEQKHDKLIDTNDNFKNVDKIMYTRGRLIEVEIILNRLKEN